MQECGLHNVAALSLCDDITKFLKDITKVELDGNNLTDIGINVVVNKMSATYGYDVMGAFDCNDPPEEDELEDRLDNISDELVEKYGVKKKVPEGIESKASTSSTYSAAEIPFISSSSEKKEAHVPHKVLPMFMACPIRTMKCPMLITNESSAPNAACESPNPNTKCKSQEKESAKVSGITFGSNITFGSQTPATLKYKETKEAARAQQSAAICSVACSPIRTTMSVCMITNESSAST